MGSSERMDLVGSAGDLPAARRILAALSADVVVVDADGCGEVGDLVEFVSERRTSVVVFTSAPDLGSLDSAVLSGLRGIVRKSESPAVLLNAVEKVHQGELWIDRSATSRMFMQLARQKAAEKNDPDRARVSLLTQRERQAIAALAADTSAPAKVIASRLCISEHTLRNHLTSIYSKLHLTNRLDLYAYATRHHLDKLAG
ncbi:response regulator transcription factor [Ramlibacter sp. AN1015]|uniref:helix-turn-helix transcriptional regulator n=1 Tax=Ramlibacter sp. AN1015 TaxID=3133428 RepID=UPI0030C0EB94